MAKKKRRTTTSPGQKSRSPKSVPAKRKGRSPRPRQTSRNAGRVTSASPEKSGRNRSRETAEKAMESEPPATAEPTVTRPKSIAKKKERKPPRKKLQPGLKAPTASFENRFRDLKSRADVARLLELPEKTLKAILYGYRERTKYVVFELVKRSGRTRKISAPPKNLSILQRKLLEVLNRVYKPKTCVTGFARGQSVVTNATPHTGKRFVLNFDIADFFPSIHLGRIRGLLNKPPYSIGLEAAEVIAQIATDNDGILPQGAPSSPIIANMVCSSMDNDLLGLAKKFRCDYTRYADDITFSTTRRNFPREIAFEHEDGLIHIGSELLEILGKNRFQVREGKTRLRDMRRRQRATGVTVNEFPNASRNYIRGLRALIHDCRTKGLEVAATRHASISGNQIVGKAEEWISRVVFGRLAYLKMIRGAHDPIYRRLLRLAVDVPLGSKQKPVALSELKSQPLRRRSSRPPDWQLLARRYDEGIFMAECASPFGGEPATGTAFLVGSSTVMTAGHNCEARYPRGRGIANRQITLRTVTGRAVEVQDVRYESDERTGVDIGLGRIDPNCSTGLFPIPTQERIPEIGEEVAAMGFPLVPLRRRDLVFHVGRVESIAAHELGTRFITVSFPSGPGLSGAPLIDGRGFCVGVMVANTFAEGAPPRPYGQAIAIEHWRDIPRHGRTLNVW